MWEHRMYTKMIGEPPYRTFGIVEVHYDENGVPDQFNMVNSLSGWKTQDDLIVAYYAISESFTKGVIDLDNFPKEYEQDRNT